MRHPGFIQVMPAHTGDWWVIDDLRVVGVHLCDGEGGRDAAHEAACQQASEISENGCFASYYFGWMPRCAASELLLGEPGEHQGADPGIVCMRGGWFDEDEDEDE